MVKEIEIKTEEICQHGSKANHISGLMDGHTASRRPCFCGTVIGHQPNSCCRILLLIFPDNVVVQGSVGGWWLDDGAGAGF